MLEFSIKDIGYLMLRLWHNKWIILFVTLSGMLAGMAFTANSEPETRYRATSSVCVTYTTYQEQMRGSSVITSYSDLVTSRLVCERAADLISDTELSPVDIQRMIENWVGSNSYVMFINATASEPQLAIRVANAVAQAFTEKVSNVSGNNSLQILDIAQTTSSLNNAIDNTVLTLAIGPFALMCAGIILYEIIGGKVRYLSQCAEDQDELLGILPDTK